MDCKCYVEISGINQNKIHIYVIRSYDQVGKRANIGLDKSAWV